MTTGYRDLRTGVETVMSDSNGTRAHDQALARQTVARFRRAGSSPLMTALRVAVLRYRLAQEGHDRGRDAEV